MRILRPTCAVLPLALLSLAQTVGEVRSANGRFVARLAPPDRIEVGEVSGAKAPEAWSVHGLRIEPSLDWRLADDGATLVSVAPAAGTPLPLVQVVRGGHLVLSADAEKLGVEPEEGGAWLRTEGSCVRMVPVQREGETAYRLDLLARDDRVRSIDLATGDVRPPLAEPDAGSPRVEPAAPEASEPVFVGEWLAPEVISFGQPIPVQVRGSLPTPSWRFAGFALRWDGSASSTIVLDPRGTIPPGGELSLQVLKGFDQTALLQGLAPGLYALDVHDRGAAGSGPRPSPRSLRVLPAWTRVFLERRSGAAGPCASTALLADGRVVRRDGTASTPRVALADEAREAEIVRMLAGLPAAPAKPRSPGGEGNVVCEIAWTVDGHPVRVVRDEPALEPGLRALVQAIDGLAAKGGAPARYAIDLAKSFIEVRTGSSGLLGALGHDHRLMVQRFSGSVERASSPEAWSVELAVEAGSLAVVDDESQADRPAIEREMQAHVLEVGRHPRIRFAATSPALGAGEGDVRSVQLEGDLELHGRTRRIRVPVRLELRGEVLRATGKVTLKQSDFGIARTTAAAGTVKVADEVEVAFDVIAVRDGAAPR